MQYKEQEEKLLLTEELCPEESISIGNLEINQPLIDIEVEELIEGGDFDAEDPSGNVHILSDAEVNNKNHEDYEKEEFFDSDEVPEFWYNLREKYGDIYPNFFKITEILYATAFFLSILSVFFILVLIFLLDFKVQLSFLLIVPGMVILSAPLIFIKDLVKKLSCFTLSLKEGLSYIFVTPIKRVYLCFREGIQLFSLIVNNDG
jgi:hypothetical protein